MPIDFEDLTDGDELEALCEIQGRTASGVLFTSRRGAALTFREMLTRTVARLEDDEGDSVYATVDQVTVTDQVDVAAAVKALHTTAKAGNTIRVTFHCDGDVEIEDLSSGPRSPYRRSFGAAFRVFKELAGKS